MKSTDEAGDRRDVGAVGEYVLCKRALLDAQMIPQQSLEHRAQVGGGLEVAAFVELFGLEAGPVRDHAAALERAAGEQRDGARAVVGAERAIDARSAPELGDDGDHGLSPRLAHAGLDRGNRAIEGAEQIKELACGGALVDMRVPTDEAERAD